MIYVGIDIAKKKHYASVMSSDGEVLVEAFSFNNDQAGFSSLLSKISSFEKKDIIIGLESTAHYGENLIFYLFSLDYKVGIINPLQTSNLRKTNIRKTKTDKVDTYLIIKTLMIGEHHYLTSRDITNLELKSYCRFRQNLFKSRTKAKIQLVAYLDHLFLELQYFFKSGIHIKACYTLLKEFTTPKAISEAHLTRLKSLLSKASKGHFGKDKAKKLKELAKLSVGIENNALSVQVIHAIEQIELYNRQIAEIEEKIENTMSAIDSVIKTIPGVGSLNGAMIISEIGDVTRFSHPSKLLAYAGLDPSVNQSGNFNAKKTKMSKRGSKTLRYALVNAAFNVSLNDKVFKDYYDLKVSQGRSHYCALGHVAHKLVRVIFKLLSTNTSFKSA